MKTMEISTPVSVRNIAFATDCSTESYAALPFAAEFAKRYGAKIWGFHVASPHTLYGRPYVYAPTLERSVPDLSRELGAEFEERLRGIPYEVSVIEHTDTWGALSSFLEKNHIDVLVMGTHGRTGFGKVVLGSVAETVFRQCQCPVLTVGPKVVRRPDQRTKEILYATDFSVRRLPGPGERCPSHFVARHRTTENR
jgi:nucleotide-binding universal stress UspA family protein